MLIILFLLTTFQANDSITVYQFSKSKTSAFEKELTKKLIDNINKSENYNYKLKFKFVTNREELGKVLNHSDQNYFLLNKYQKNDENKNIYDFSEPYLTVKEAVLTLVNQFWYEGDWKPSGSKIGVFKKSKFYKKKDSFIKSYQSKFVFFDRNKISSASELLLKAKFDFFYFRCY